MATDAAERMFAGLPAVYRNRDVSGDLSRLLDVLGVYLFTGGDAGLARGLEKYLDDIPSLFAPMGLHGQSDGVGTPERFLHWLATWLSFTPHALFAPERLRQIISGIVPLYGHRGTRMYLVELLKLCFRDELGDIEVDDRPGVGFTIGKSTVGVDTRLAVSRPFSFRVTIGMQAGPDPESHTHDRGALGQRLRAVIDFAKPAHTTYELMWRGQQDDMRRRHGSPDGNGRGSGPETAL